MKNVNTLGALEEEIILVSLYRPPRSLDDFECQEWQILTKRKVCAKFQVSMCTGRGDSSCISSEWSLDDFECQE